MQLSVPGQVNGSPVDHLPLFPPIVWWTIAALAAVVVTVFTLWQAKRGIGALLHLATSASDEHKARVRDMAAGAWRNGSLFVCWSFAAAISANGLIGFGEDNMLLPLPLAIGLFVTLDVAAGMLLVLLMQRAARSESALGPRLGVWGLASASSYFNATHAPDKPGAVVAYALIPVIAAFLFELGLSQIRRQAGRSDRRMGGVRWLHPIERTRVLSAMAADESLSADQATTNVRVTLAAQRMYQLRRAWRVTGWWRQRRAQAALNRVGFSDSPVTRERVLRQLQVITQTTDLATLDYRTPVAARVALQNLIGSPVVTPVAGPALPAATGPATTHRPTAAHPILPLGSHSLVPLTVGQGDRLATSVRPANGHAPTGWATAPLVGTIVGVPVDEVTAGLTGEGSDSDHTGDRKRPTEQVNRKAVTWVMRQIRSGNVPAKNAVADRYGFSNGWGYARIQDAKRSLGEEGWMFPRNDDPIPPASDSTTSDL